MKTLVTFFAAFVLFATNSYSQNQHTVFESANLTKFGDGSPCVQLDWKKGAENTAYYVVERSSDGTAFKKVAFVFTWEDSQLASYKFRDKNFDAGGNTAYYRIGIVNEQKKVTYLPVRRVRISSAETIALDTTSTEMFASNTHK